MNVSCLFVFIFGGLFFVLTRTHTHVFKQSRQSPMHLELMVEQRANELDSKCTDGRTPVSITPSGARYLPSSPSLEFPAISDVSLITFVRLDQLEETREVDTDLFDELVCDTSSHEWVVSHLMHVLHEVCKDVPVIVPNGSGMYASMVTPLLVQVLKSLNATPLPDECDRLSFMLPRPLLEEVTGFHSPNVFTPSRRIINEMINQLLVSLSDGSVDMRNNWMVSHVKYPALPEFNYTSFTVSHRMKVFDTDCTGEALSVYSRCAFQYGVYSEHMRAIGLQRVGDAPNFTIFTVGDFSRVDLHAFLHHLSMVGPVMRKYLREYFLYAEFAQTNTGGSAPDTHHNNLMVCLPIELKNAMDLLAWVDHFMTHDDSLFGTYVFHDVLNCKTTVTNPCIALLQVLIGGHDCPLLVETCHHLLRFMNGSTSAYNSHKITTHMTEYEDDEKITGVVPIHTRTLARDHLLYNITDPDELENVVFVHPLQEDTLYTKDAIVLFASTKCDVKFAGYNYLYEVLYDDLLMDHVASNPNNPPPMFLVDGLGLCVPEGVMNETYCSSDYNRCEIKSDMETLSVVPMTVLTDDLKESVDMSTVKPAINSKSRSVLKLVTPLVIPNNSQRNKLREFIGTTETALHGVPFQRTDSEVRRVNTDTVKVCVSVVADLFEYDSSMGDLVLLLNKHAFNPLVDTLSVITAVSQAAMTVCTHNTHNSFTVSHDNLGDIDGILRDDFRIRLDECVRIFKSTGSRYGNVGRVATGVQDRIKLLYELHGYIVKVHPLFEKFCSIVSGMSGSEFSRPFKAVHHMCHLATVDTSKPSVGSRVFGRLMALTDKVFETSSEMGEEFGNVIALLKRVLRFLNKYNTTDKLYRLGREGRFAIWADISVLFCVCDSDTLMNTGLCIYDDCVSDSSQAYFKITRAYDGLSCVDCSRRFSNSTVKPSIDINTTRDEGGFDEEDSYDPSASLSDYSDYKHTVYDTKETTTFTPLSPMTLPPPIKDCLSPSVRISPKPVKRTRPIVLEPAALTDTDSTPSSKRRTVDSDFSFDDLSDDDDDFAYLDEPEVIDVVDDCVSDDDFADLDKPQTIEVAVPIEEDGGLGDISDDSDFDF